MLYHKLKFIFRTLWNNRFFTVLNILGLSVGLAATWVVFQVVQFEFSYDTVHPNREQVYRVVSNYTNDGKESGNAGVPVALAKVVADVAGVEMAVPVFSKYFTNVTVPGFGGGNPRVFEENLEGIVETEGRYFQLTPYKWLAGNPVSALEAPAQVVLTQSRAARYFPGLSPDQLLGQTLLYNDTMRSTVSGVVADLNYPSAFEAQEMRSFPKPITLEKKSWSGVSSNNQLFIQLEPKADPNRVVEQINQVAYENSHEFMAKYNITRWHQLQPLRDVHFDKEHSSQIRSANPKILFGMMAVAAFLLLLAVINYINLATAQLPQRSREIGVRKTLGGQNGSIIGKFLGETAVTTTASVALAVVLANLFLTKFHDLIPGDPALSTFTHLGSMVGFALALVVVVSLLSGLYPGWLMARFQPASLLRGQVAKSNKTGIRMRQGLIVFQFVVSQLLLVVALVVGQQMKFLMQQDLGFNREAMVMVDIPYKILQKPEMKTTHFLLADAFRKLPEVVGVSLGEQLFSNSYSSNTHTAVNEKGQVSEHDLNFRSVDTAAIGLYQLPILAGRNLLPSDTAREYVINETALEVFGFASPQAAIGQILKENQGKSYPIVGVVRDFQMLSSHEKIEPIALLCDRSNQSTLSIKLTGSDLSVWQAGLKKMESEWQKLYPAVPFKYHFYDEVLAEIYAEDRKIATLASGTMGIALLISCLGLFGLSMFTILRRTKEIGIRKVIGASVANITSLLTRDFLKLVLIAIVIASPVAYYVLLQWLSDFAYRIDIRWWMFLLAGFGAILIAFLTVSVQSIRAALANPVKSLRSE